MSRYEVLHDDKGLAFGTDNVFGEFMMIWKRPTDPEQRDLQDMFGPNPEEILVDYDTVTNPEMTAVQLAYIIHEHGFAAAEMEHMILGGNN